MQLDYIDYEPDPADIPGYNVPDIGDDASAGTLHNIYNRRSNGGQRVPGLSREEFDRCVEKKVCFRCKNVGHWARNCPNANPRSNSNNGSKNGKDQRRH